MRKNRKRPMRKNPGILADQIMRREAVRRMTVDDGMSARDIAAFLGVTVRMVQRDREILRLSKPKPSPMTADEIAKARELIEDGCSLTEVAATLNRSSSTIGKYCKGLSKLNSDPLLSCRSLIARLGL